VVYIYCNPSHAGLCDSIEQYPGLSSWSAFRDCTPSLDAEVEIEARWYPVSEIPTIPKSRCLSPRQDAAFYRELKESEQAVRHPIVLKPFKWLETYGVTEPHEIEKIRQRIINRVREAEHVHVRARASYNKQSVSPAALRQALYMKPHKPKKKKRKIFSSQIKFKFHCVFTNPIRMDALLTYDVCLCFL
jgi:hypothetical protein